jgi:predicted amidohydrolase YtcJ
MARRITTVFAILFASLLLHSISNAASEADLVLRNGRIYTMDAARSWVDAIAIREGKIVFVGPESQIDKWIGSKTRVIDLAGKMVLPSFIDSHVHPVSAGMEMTMLDFGTMEKKEEILKAIAEFAASHPDEKWIRGNTWQLPVFPQANPKKEWLDQIVPDRPALMTAADGHSIWVNSKALELAGITKDTPDPEGGRIERNEKGEPSGTLRESAMDLVYKIAPKATAEDRYQGLMSALKRMNELGITGFKEASAGPESLAAYHDAEKRGELTARVTVSQYADPEKPSNQIDDFVKMREKYKGARVNPSAVKIFVDGVIESNTAAMLAPYLDTKEPGKLLWSPEKLNPFVERLYKEGFQVHFHAIGDRAIRVALDAVEHARKANHAGDHRPILAHIELIDPVEVRRFVKLDAIASFQPLWAYEDTYIKDLTVPKLGPERSRWIYPLHSVSDTGAVMAFGSDWSVSSVNPLDGIEVAVTRRDADAGQTGSAFIPQERIDLSTALAAYTIGGAYANFWENETGSLEVGKSADLIVLSQNLFEIEPSEINKTKVLLTMLEGKILFTIL